MNLLGFLSSADEGVSDPLDMSSDALRDELALYKRAFLAVTDVVTKTAEGDLSARVTDWDSHGHLSDTLAKLNHSYDLSDAYVREAGASLQAALKRHYYREFLSTGMRGDYGQAAKVINSTTLAIQQAELERRAHRKKLADDFEASVMEIVTALSSVAQQTHQCALDLMKDAEETQRRSSTVAAASEQATTNVQTVAAAAEELTASIEEISSQVATSSQKTSEASTGATEASETIEQLDGASRRIGDVINLINDIADQTNLLALNATIEAARAGEMGKGFAVVASEVKSLAKQTAGATDDIKEQVSNIQSQTGDAVEAVANISQSMALLRDTSMAIASATEEQSAATLEISRNIQEATEGTIEVTSSIATVLYRSEETLTRAKEMKAVAEDMKTKTLHLMQQSEEFVSNIRIG